MADLIGEWASDATTRGIDPKTIEAYGYSLRHYEKSLAGQPVADADKLAARAYIEEHRKQGLTTRTIQRRLNALSSFYEFLVFEGKKADNPIRGVWARYLSQYKTDSEKHTHKIIGVEEAAMLLDPCVDIRDKAMILVMLKTGVRRGELLSM